MKSSDSSSPEDSPTHQEIGYKIGKEQSSKHFHHLSRVLEVKFKEGMKRNQHTHLATQK